MRFFEFHKGHRPRTIIKELLHERQAFLEEMDISQCVQFFPQNLYTRDVVVENNIQARCQCLKSVPSMVTKQ
jgi:hypothetical protein